MNKQVSPKIVALTFGVLVVSFLVAFYVVAWQEPTEAPPGGNVDTPLNVGPDGQSKVSGLILNTGDAENLPAPNALVLDNGNLCLGGVCLASWPVGGGSGSGSAIFGDGSDGDVTISIDTTLIRDMYYNNLTVNNSVILNTGGYRIFIKSTLTNNGIIKNNGSNASGGNGGSGAPSGTVRGGGNGGDIWSGSTGAGAGGGGGGVIFIAAKVINNSAGTISANGGNGSASGVETGDNGPGGAGDSVTSSIGGSGGKGGTSGDSLNPPYAPGGSGGGTTAPLSGYRSSLFAGFDLLGLKALGGGAGAGAGGVDFPELGGGGGGGGGGIIIIYNSATWGIEQVNGGSGASGGSGGDSGVNGSPGIVIKIAN